MFIDREAVRSKLVVGAAFRRAAPGKPSKSLGRVLERDATPNGVRIRVEYTDGRSYVQARWGDLQNMCHHVADFVDPAVYEAAVETARLNLREQMLASRQRWIAANRPPKRPSQPQIPAAQTAGEGAVVESLRAEVAALRAEVKELDVVVGRYFKKLIVESDARGPSTPEDIADAKGASDAYFAARGGLKLV